MNRKKYRLLQSSSSMELIRRATHGIAHEVLPLWLLAATCAGGFAPNVWCQSSRRGPERNQQVPGAPRQVPPPAPALAPSAESTISPESLAGECINLAEEPVTANKPDSRAPQPTVAPCVVLRDLHQVNTSSSAKLNGSVTVVLHGLRDWVWDRNDPNRLRLYLAGRMLPDAVPVLINLSQDYVNFDLKLNPDDRSLWVQIMAEARRQPGHRIPVSVGLLEEKQPFESSTYLSFAVYPWYTPYVLGLLVVLLIALIWLGMRYDLLRDTVAKPPARPARRPFSLGRVQMAVWFYLVVAAYLYIWLITSEHNTPTSSVLTLIGISAGTGLAAVFVDSSKSESSSNERGALESQHDALVMRISEIEAAPPEKDSTLYNDLQEKKSNLAKVNADIAHLPPKAPIPVTRGFVRDLLGGGDDMSFHRFQIAVWTIVLALIFVASVYADLAMPEFEPSLLGLMGISSGTYLGFKFPEKVK